ncbi:MAG: hypothetical protein ACKOCA_09075 [Vulcanococcus sp.]
MLHKHIALTSGAIILLSVSFGLTFATRRDATLIELEEERILLTYRIQETRSLSKSWGYRNDSFDLLNRRHPDFARLHLRDPDLLGNQRILLFLDLKGKTAFNSLQQEPTAHGKQVLPDLKNCLAAIEEDLKKPLQSITRICPSRSGPYILGASTITNDTWDAPVNGRVGIFTPVNAPPSTTIHDKPLVRRLEGISNRHLQIDSNSSNSSNLWQISLPIDQDFGLDTPAGESQARLIEPIAFSANDWTQVVSPLLLVATALVFNGQWNLLQRRKTRLIKQRHQHVSSQISRKLQRFSLEHGLLNKKIFARRFEQRTAWNWSLSRQLALIELDLGGDINSLQGTAITLQKLMPGLCKTLSEAGLDQTACQYRQNTILACFPCAEASPNTARNTSTVIASLHQQCTEHLAKQDILAPWTLTISHTTANQEIALADHEKDLLLTSKAARKLGVQHMALDHDNPAFIEAQQEQKAMEDVISAMRGITPLGTRTSNVYHCPSSKPNDWSIHHRRLSPIPLNHNTGNVNKTRQDPLMQNSTEDICHQLGLDHILLKQMSDAAFKEWESSGRTCTIAIRLGKVRPGEHRSKAQLLQRCLDALPTELSQHLIIGVDTHNLNDDEACELMQDLRELGPKLMHENPMLGLSFESTPDFIRINCKEFDQHKTDTLISLCKLLQDVSLKIKFQLVGEAICSDAQFHLWHKLGLRLFEGDWIEHMAQKASNDYHRHGFS